MNRAYIHGRHICPDETATVVNDHWICNCPKRSPRTTIIEGLRIARRHAMSRARADKRGRALHVRDARDINHHLVRELKSQH